MEFSPADENSENRLTVDFRHQFENGWGPNYGFTNAQAAIRKALSLHGVRFSHAADRTLCHVSAHLFQPVPGKTNFLWNPFEATAVAPEYVRWMDRADVVIASCDANKGAFERSGLIRPVKVCPLGIDTEVFRYSDRPVAEKLIFLWLGQNDPRKGWDLAVRAFAKAFTPNDPAVLYIKTTRDREPGAVGRIHDNVVFDCRNLATADLLDLYHGSHVFVFPSRGEGTGLPALEAMATGQLVMAPPVMGLSDFIDSERAVPLAFDWVDAWYGMDIQAPNVRVDDLAEKMRWCLDHYEETAGIRKAGADWVVKNRNLSKTGKRLKEILFEIWGGGETGADLDDLSERASPSTEITI